MNNKIQQNKNLTISFGWTKKWHRCKKKNETQNLHPFSFARADVSTKTVKTKIEKIWFQISMQPKSNETLKNAKIPKYKWLSNPKMIMLQNTAYCSHSLLKRHSFEHFLFIK